MALFAVGGCTEETKVVKEFAACGPDAPTGSCEAGKACFQGACVEAASLCSATNLAGTCAEGMTCFGGGCVLASSLCGSANPAGPCETGKVCFQGACAATASLCSSSNKTGACLTGAICQEGVCAAPGVDPCSVQAYAEQPAIGVDSRSKLVVDGREFKDLSGDGALDPYEDWRLIESCRAKDLVSKMSVPQKVGLMSEGSRIGSGTADGTIPATVSSVVVNDHIRQALIRLGSRSAQELAVYLNNLQKLAEAQPLGIPFVVTADPVHGFGMSTNATSGAQSLSASTVVSPWPYPLGLGAINDAEVTRQYGDTVRREFMAMGFRWQLGPMVDLGTEPRWARVQNVFGENAFHVAKHSKACIEGFQGAGQGGLRNGIAATMKHFPGAGPDEDGKDSHRPTGKWNVFPGDYFEYHQIAFRAAIDAGAAAVMPCYSIFKGQLDYDPDQVGAAFSKGLITNYLKEALGFSGMVTSDWGTMGSNSAHGVEALTQPERVARFVKAGSHQLGSDSHTLVQAAYDQGLITEAEIDQAAAKILEMSFRLGIFENPYVDSGATPTIARSNENLTNGFVAQKKAIVLLKNREHSTTANSGARYLPIDGSRYTDLNSNGAPDVGEYLCDVNADGVVKVYFDGVVDALAGSDVLDGALGAYDYASAGGNGALAVVRVDSAAEADLAVLRITARKGTYSGLDEGVPLSFDAPFPGTQTDTNLPAAIKDRNKVLDLLRVRDGYSDANGEAVGAANPTLKIVLVMHMDRPGIVRPFINGLTTLDEKAGEPGSYPLVSDPANTRADGLGGVDGFLVEFGAFDRAVLDVLFNKNLPTSPAGYVYGTSRLPMEIPSTDAEVAAQFEDVPADTWSPTFALGAGMTL